MDAGLATPPSWTRWSCQPYGRHRWWPTDDRSLPMSVGPRVNARSTKHRAVADIGVRGSPPSPRFTWKSAFLSLPHDCLDPICCGLWILVLPNTQDGPSLSDQGFVISSVSGNIALELLPPPSGVGGGHDPVLRTTVPEASVHEDNHPRWPENYVCPAAQAGKRCHVLPKSESASMKSRAQGTLWRGVGTRLGDHPGSRRRGGRGR
jgi:hypothetical protein